MMLTFTYRNHKGVTQERTVANAVLEFIHHPGYGYQPGWFITGVCQEKNAVRSFALSNVVLHHGVGYKSALASVSALAVGGK